MSLVVADIEAICTEPAMPVSSGPITVTQSSCWSILVEIEAECAAGMTGT